MTTQQKTKCCFNCPLYVRQPNDLGRCEWNLSMIPLPSSISPTVDVSHVLKKRVMLPTDGADCPHYGTPLPQRK